MQNKNSYPKYDAYELLESIHEIIGEEAFIQLKDEITNQYYSKKNGKPITINDWLINFVQGTIQAEEIYLKSFKRKTINNEQAKSLMIKLYIVTYYYYCFS